MATPTVAVSIPPNAFIGKTSPPTDEDLSRVLGRAKAIWDRTISLLRNEFGVTAEEWKCYSPKSGWGLRILKNKRTVVWLTAHHRLVEAGFILGDKAIQAAKDGAAPKAILERIAAGQKYPEGTGIRVHLRKVDDIGVVKELAAIKLAT